MIQPSLTADATNLPFVPLQNQGMTGGGRGHGHTQQAQAQVHYDQRYNQRRDQPQYNQYTQQQPRQLHQPQNSDQYALQRQHQIRVNQQPQQQLLRGSSRTHANNPNHQSQLTQQRIVQQQPPFINVSRHSSSSMTSRSASSSNVKKVAPGRFAAVKQIGQGTFADIWEVYALDGDGRPDPTEEKHFALKALRKGKCVGADGKIDATRYHRYSCAILAEGNRIAQLNERDPECRAQVVRCREVLLPRDVSPNLAASVAGDVRTNPIGPCVVLELLGVSLMHFEIARRRNNVAIPLSTVRYIGLQLLNAMSFLHGVGCCIHADLKPQNVVLSLEHSVNGNLLSNAYPDVKVVDLGNAIAIGRTVRTFEVQSLHYRAPEIIFGNEVTAAIDLWSIGCILLQLAFAPTFSKNSSLRHHAVFASRNNAQLASRIASIVSSFPAYFYNGFASCNWSQYLALATKLSLTHCAHCDADYLRQQMKRRERLFEWMHADPATADAELTDFLDFVARLLDPNPATRLTSEDATQHRFCIGAEYVRHDEKIFELLRTKFDSAFPRVTISSDADRQRRLDAQLHKWLDAQDRRTAPRPSATATARRTSHSDEQCTDPLVRHSRAVCLVRGCCDIVTLPSTSTLPLQNSNCLAAIHLKSVCASPATLSPKKRRRPLQTRQPSNKRI